MQNEDPTASSRKQDHIELAFASQTPHADERFYYEPLFTGNHTDIHQLACHFAGHQLEAPIWISSMTGGTEKAGHINKTWRHCVRNSDSAWAWVPADHC